MGCSNCDEYVLPGFAWPYVQAGDTVKVYPKAYFDYVGIGKTVRFYDDSGEDGFTDITGDYVVTSLSDGIQFDVSPPTSFNGNVHSGSAVIDGINNTVGFLVGMTLTGAGIPASASISSIPDTATIIMSAVSNTSSYENVTATPNYRASGSIFMLGDHWELRTCAYWEDTTYLYSSITLHTTVLGQYNSVDTTGTSRAGSGTEYTNTTTPYTYHDYTINDTYVQQVVTKGNINSDQTYTFSPYPYPVTSSAFLENTDPDLEALDPPLANGQFIMLKCPGCCIKTMNRLYVMFDTSSYVQVHDDYYWFNGSMVPDSGQATWKVTTTQTSEFAEGNWNGQNGSDVVTNEFDGFDHIPLLGGLSYSDASYYCNPTGEVTGSLEMGFNDTRFLLETDSFNQTETDSEETALTYTPSYDGSTTPDYSFSTSSVETDLGPIYDLQTYVGNTPSTAVYFQIFGDDLAGTYTHSASYIVPSSSAVVTSASSVPDGGNFDGGGSPRVYRDLTDTTNDHTLVISADIVTSYELDIVPV